MTESITLTRAQLLRACGNAGVAHTVAQRIIAYLAPLPEPENTPAATITGRVLEVGNLDGGNVPGFVIDSGNLQYVTVSGITEDQARAVAWHYDKPITITITRDTLAPCEAEIFQHGAVVAVLDAGKLAMQGLVDEANRTTPGLDWHYVGGRAVVKRMGDAKEARLSLLRALPRFIDGGM